MLSVLNLVPTIVATSACTILPERTGNVARMQETTSLGSAVIRVL